MENILITGADGFIASHLIEALIKDGSRMIYGLERPSSSLKRLENFRHNSNFELIEADLTDRGVLSRALKEIKISKVIHLAGRVSPERDFACLREMIGVNLLGYLNLIESINPNNLKIFFKIGTCEEYGNNKAPFLEEMKESPVSPYSFSNICATYLGNLFSNIKDMPVITLRSFLTFGERQDVKLLIPTLICNCLKNKEMPLTCGEQTRDVNYVINIVEWIRLLLDIDFDKFSKRLVNLASGKQTKIKDLALLIAKLTNSKSVLDFGRLPYRKGEVLEFYADNNYLKSLIAYEEKFTLEEGLVSTIEWYRNHVEFSNE